VIPHLIDEIKNIIYSQDANIVVVEVGGTVGDIEGLPFLEAIRQIKLENQNNTLTIHVTYVPYLQSTGELKTKPTQHSVNKLREIGINPDCIIARSTFKISNELKNKIALFSNLPPSNILSIEDTEIIYSVPKKLIDEGFNNILKKIKIKVKKSATSDFDEFVEKYKKLKNKKPIKIAIAGKYVELIDSYKSLNEAILHAAVNLGLNVKIDYLNTENNFDNLNEYSGFIIPGGFGKRGVAGKIKIIEYTRKNLKPLLGICFGMQLAVIEAIRNNLKINADSTELNPKTKLPVVKIIPSAKGEIGGTMKLGEHKCILKNGSLAQKIYTAKYIFRRHRHRYEINKKYLNLIEKAVLEVTGWGPDGSIEIIELKTHPFFTGTQFHPEFSSTPLKPDPLFIEFLKACYESSRS
ncbi:MAG: CTP synthase, partial [bacterium]|nr:CTP synthase [bacterium]